MSRCGTQSWQRLRPKRSMGASGTGGMRVCALVAVAMCGSAASAQRPAEFYQGKTLDLYVGYSAGAGYDLYARLLARHLGKHIPGNPALVARNMDGAGSLRLANWLYNVAPRDGTAIGMIGRGVAFDPMLARPGIQFEGTKFSWLGSITNEVSACVTWHTSAVKTIEDAKKQEVIVGAVGAGADDDEFPRIINGLLGTKMRVISGYPGGNEVILAMQRGEVNGRCGWSWSSIKAIRPAWITDHTINLLGQIGLSKHPDLPDVPLIIDLAKTEEQRKVFTLIFSRQGLARPFLAPPGLPPERLAALREAFMATMRDPEFLAQARTAKMEVEPLSGADVERLVHRVYRDTSPAIAKLAASMLR